MEDVDVILGGIGPHVELDDPDAPLERLDDWDVAAVAAELVAGEVGVVAGVYEVVGERRGHVVVDLGLAGGRVEVVGEEEAAVEVVEGDERASDTRDAGAAMADLVEEAVDVAVAVVAGGVEVAAEAVGVHVGPGAGVLGEEDADVVGRRRVAPVEAALEDEAALVRPHGPVARVAPSIDRFLCSALLCFKRREGRPRRKGRPMMELLD